MPVNRGTDDVRFEVGGGMTGNQRKLSQEKDESLEMVSYVHCFPRFYLQKVCRKTTQALLLVVVTIGALGGTEHSFKVH